MTGRGIAFHRVPVQPENPLLDEAFNVDPAITRRGLSTKWDLYRAGDVPNPDLWLRSYDGRRRLIKTYAWAIPSQEALEAIAAWSPLVEIGAGTGYWASLLAAMGADVAAYDEAPGFNDWTDHAVYHPVSVGTHLAVHSHQDRALFLCWPPMSDMASLALQAYTGRRLIYAGEYGGCCADDGFFEQIDRGWTEVRALDLPQWWGLNDALWLFERKEET